MLDLKSVAATMEKLSVEILTAPIPRVNKESFRARVIVRLETIRLEIMLLQCPKSSEANR